MDGRVLAVVCHARIRKQKIDIVPGIGFDQPFRELEVELVDPSGCVGSMRGARMARQDGRRDERSPAIAKNPQARLLSYCRDRIDQESYEIRQLRPPARKMEMISHRSLKRLLGLFGSPSSVARLL